VRAAVHLARERRSSLPVSAGASGEADKIVATTPRPSFTRWDERAGITASVRERAKDAAMIEERPEMALAMVREAIEMLTAARA
jgi:hypothetical protein